jgi:hypothetical protein
MITGSHITIATEQDILGRAKRFRDNERHTCLIISTNGTILQVRPFPGVATAHQLQHA